MAMCIKKHPLVRFTAEELLAESNLYSAYVCDKCQTKYKGTSFHCSPCSYDLCFECYRKGEVFHVTAPKLLSTKQRTDFLSLVKKLQGKTVCFFCLNVHDRLSWV